MSFPPTIDAQLILVRRLEVLCSSASQHQKFVFASVMLQLSGRKYEHAVLGKYTL